MFGRAALRLLVGVLALLATLVDPAAKLAHGCAHAREARQAAAYGEHVAAATGASTAGAVARTTHADPPAPTVAEMDHDDAAHPALHRAGAPAQPELTFWIAPPNVVRHVVPAPPAVARVAAVTIDEAPPDVRALVTPDRPRAPPLG